jgi:hypothetical protein
VTFGFFRVYENNSIRTAVYLTTRSQFHTGGGITVHTGNRSIGNFHAGILSAFLFYHMHPEMTGHGLGKGVRKMVIAAIFIFTG